MTTGAPGFMFTKDGIQGDIHEINFPTNHGIFYFCGMTPLESFYVYSPAHIGEESRKGELARYAAYIDGIESVPAIKYKTLEQIFAPKPIIYMKRG